jgi:pyruvate,water dikinase
LAPEEARRLAAARLAGRRCLGIVPRRWVYFGVLKRAAAAVRNRENQRLARTRAFGLVRRIFRAMGASLAADGHIAAADDVFYLTVPEIETFVAGTGAVDLRAAAARRRELYARFRALPPLPEHLETDGPVGEEEVLPVAPAQRPAAALLKGTGACPGVVEAPAAVLLEPDRAVRLDGQILVARQTDPGWVVLFPSVSAIVVERGGMLSHSAIVAREMGIPAVVGVAGATELIRTGDRLRLDGGRGTVEILERAGEAGR